MTHEKYFRTNSQYSIFKNKSSYKFILRNTRISQGNFGTNVFRKNFPEKKTYVCILPRVLTAGKGFNAKKFLFKSSGF